MEVLHARLAPLSQMYGMQGRSEAPSKSQPPSSLGRIPHYEVFLRGLELKTPTLVAKKDLKIPIVSRKKNRAS